MLLVACAGQKAERTEASLNEGRLLQGAPLVLSGQSLQLEGRELRLYGIRTPPEGQGCVRPGGRRYDCGRIAKTALMDLTAGATIACEILHGRGDDGRVVARCRAGGYDLSEGMVHAGWAVSWPQAAGPFEALEKRARSDARGMWNGRFDPAWSPANPEG